MVFINSRFVPVFMLHMTMLFTKTTAAQDEVVLSYHKVRGLYFMAVVFVTSDDYNISSLSIVLLDPLSTTSSAGTVVFLSGMDPEFPKAVRHGSRRWFWSHPLAPYKLNHGTLTSQLLQVTFIRRLQKQSLPRTST